MSTNSVDKNRRFFVRKQRPKTQGCKNAASRASARVLALTISSNYAKDKDSFDVYYYVISRLPTGTFVYTREKSKYGKYHVHGILYLTYNFDYKTLQASKHTSDGNEFNLHIEYKRVYDKEGWQGYSSKSGNIERSFQCDPSQARPEIPIPQGTCIPEIKKIVKVKTLAIPGI